LLFVRIAQCSVIQRPAQFNSGLEVDFQEPRKYHAGLAGGSPFPLTLVSSATNIVT